MRTDQLTMHVWTGFMDFANIWQNSLNVMEIKIHVTNMAQCIMCKQNTPPVEIMFRHSPDYGDMLIRSHFAL